MQKITKVLSILALMSTPVLVMAVSNFWDTEYVSMSMTLTQKDDSWQPLNGGIIGRLQLRRDGYAKLKVSSGLPRYKRYTLIYYGDDTHNDQWPYATCLGEGMTYSRGQLYLHGDFPQWVDFLQDGVPQKVWLVPSSDVDCVQGQLTAWNPSEYLFEPVTI